MPREEDRVVAPLEGIRVVEVANWLAAPSAAALMADLGADVIKVEPPAGDFYRGYMSHLRAAGGVNVNFELDNRGKRSVTVDLERPGGTEVVLRLCRGADVFITNLTRQRIARYGLGFDAVRGLSPRIVYGALSGYGSRGPDADKAGFDAGAFWAASGIMALMGQAGTPLVQSRGGQGDHPTGLNLLAAVLAALRLRDRTGEAQFVDVTLQRTGLWTIGGDVTTVLNADDPQQPERVHRATRGMVTWNAYAMADGRQVMLVMNTPERYWEPFARAVGYPEWAANARYRTTPELLANGAELLPAIEARFLEHDSRYWYARLDEFGLLWAPVALLPDVAHDPQLRELGAFTRVDLPGGGSYETLSAPFEIAGADVRVRGPAPRAGEHTYAVLQEIGMTAADIAALAEAGVFG
jgi:crotonobetainyl-CoA:carnitine CoA-transferase CaiB-like acyl-CoA transferase